MKYSIVAASLLAATVSAQSLTDLPACSLPCALKNLGKVTKCTPSASNIMDPKIQACLCDSPEFQTAFAECAKDKAQGACSDTDQCSLFETSQKICGGKLSVAAPNAKCSGAQPAPTTSAAATAAPTTSAAATAAPGTSAPVDTAPASGSGTASAPVTSGTATGSAPPSYGTGATTIATTAAGTGATTGPAAPSGTFTAGASSSAVVNGVAALFAGLLAVFAL